MNKPKQILIDHLINKFSSTFVNQTNLLPWEIIEKLTAILNELILHLDANFDVKNGIAIHKTATIEQAM